MTVLGGKNTASLYEVMITNDLTQQYATSGMLAERYDIPVQFYVLYWSLVRILSIVLSFSALIGSDNSIAIPHLYIKKCSKQIIFISV